MSDIRTMFVAVESTGHFSEFSYSGTQTATDSLSGARHLRLLIPSQKKCKRPAVNPFEETGEPWFCRKMHLISLRVRFRDALKNRSAAALADVERLIASFPDDAVRGDFVPTKDAARESVAAVLREFQKGKDENDHDRSVGRSARKTEHSGADLVQGLPRHVAGIE